MLREAKTFLTKEIAIGKVEVQHCCVAKMPFQENTFDSVMHVNSYYFWPDIDQAVAELLRVTKNQGRIVSTINIERLNEYTKKGVFSYSMYDPERYMSSLQKHGFLDIELRDMKDRLSFLAVTATVSK